MFGLAGLKAGQAGRLANNGRIGGEAANLGRVGKAVKVVSTELSNGRLEYKLNLNAFSKAGRIHDRGGLTRAGRALDKHGGRPGSVFPKATGNPAAKNMQGQYHLDDILTNPNSITSIEKGYGIEIYAPNGRGVFFEKMEDFVDLSKIIRGKIHV
ncbi:MAG: hypothetical protein S4CHLAM123_10450 [Chlamydiales bacterium]|nr:hypothetical protein [Chlamydiales bacterium]